ncbi:HNH endonuclease [Rhizobium leguminosarum]|uniref:HNH endonuclease n=1 Tax=Rhizobium leguminosarum TaxID=384 RepID=UPI002E13F656|nr:HNH endonuclease [Rhizobium leguminosarum]WSH77618.1 hypothetical protein U8Q02_36905 [Rhizobium leguminosarum]
MMNLLNMLVKLALAITLSMAPVLPGLQSSAEAGIVKKIVAVRTASKVLKGARLAKKYSAELKRVSKIAPTRQQRKLLFDCLRKPVKGCIGSMKAKDWDKLRPSVKEEWVKNTGRPWPKYEKDILSKNGRPYRKAGDDWEAHHIIPKDKGGPHEWWNVHPVPRPEHQGVIHARDAILNKMMEMMK